MKWYESGTLKSEQTLFLLPRKRTKKNDTAMLEYEIVYKSNFPEVFFKNGVI